MGDFHTRDRMTVHPVHVRLLCGPSRNGKSWAARAASRSGYTVLGTDDIRRALGVEYDAKLESIVYTTFEVAARALVLRGQKTILDGTFLTKASRARMMRKLSDIPNMVFEIFAVHPPKTDEGTRRWHKTIERDNFPMAVIEDQLSKWEPPSADELAGFDCPYEDMEPEDFLWNIDSYHDTIEQ